MSDRKLLLKRLLTALSIGIIYFIWVKLTRITIPCPIRLLSGGRIKCPGCGISTMFLRIAELNFKAAFAANPCIFILLIVWGIFISIRLIFSPKSFREGGIVNKIFYYSSSVVLLIFGILRNIF